MALRIAAALPMAFYFRLYFTFSFAAFIIKDYYLHNRLSAGERKGFGLGTRPVAFVLFDDLFDVKRLASGAFPFLGVRVKKEHVPLIIPLEDLRDIFFKFGNTFSGRYSKHAVENLAG